MLARYGVCVRNIVLLLQLHQSFALFLFFIPVKARFLKFMIGHGRFVASRDECQPLFRLNHLFRQSCFFQDHFYISAGIVDQKRSVESWYLLNLALWHKEYIA